MNGNGLRRNLSVAACLSGVFVLLGCAQRSEPAPVEAVYQGHSVYDFTRGSLQSNTYQVQRGDTLYSIAFRAEMDLRDVARLNSLQEPYQIFPGQVLRLDRQSAAQPVAVASSDQNRTNNRQNSSNEGKDTVKNDLNSSVASTIEPEYGENRRVRNESANQSNTSTGSIDWQWPSQGRIVHRFSANQPGASGIVFTGRKGDPVTAAADGKVVYVGSALRGFGRLIILKHGDDYITAYAHNQELLVEEQQQVAAGQQIATMGDSDADDVRLRFELRYQGSSVNPEQYLPRSR